jgi:ABC-type transport system involved in multi-copper enzyme maturation permease subunit
MKGTLAVAAREIAERKLVFLGAFVAGLLPLGFPLLPALRGNAHDARSVAMLLLAATIAVACPIVFGATILAGDIAQKRLSFYFSRPLPAASIWAGKLLGALLISVGCALLAAAPVLLVEGKGSFSVATGGLDVRDLLALALPGVLLLFLLAHVAASMVRLRSAWIVLDFTLAVVFAVAIALSLRSLFPAGFWGFHEGWRSAERLLWWLPVALIAIFLAASYVQVSDGRTDVRRSHGALSATLWGMTAVFAAILGGLAW